MWRHLKLSFQITSLPGGYDNLQVVAYRASAAGSCIGN